MTDVNAPIPPLKLKFRGDLRIEATIVPTAPEQAALAELTSFAAGLDGLPPSQANYAALRRQIMLLGRSIQPFFLRQALTGVTDPELRRHIEDSICPLELEALQKELEARRRDGNLGRRQTKLKIPLGVKQH